MLTHRRLHGPPEIFGAVTAPDWRAQQRRSLREQASRYARAPFVPRHRVIDQAVAIRVEHGRWCAACPACGQTMAASPEWSLALCFACGAEYVNAVPPADWPAIESALLEREVEHRNWLPGESVGDLIAENRTHGITTGGL